MNASKETRFIAFVIVFILTFNYFLWATSGWEPVSIIGTSMVIGAVAWFFTTLRRPADPAKVLPAYLLTVAFLFLHIIEEYVFDFAGAIASTFGSDWSNHSFSILLGTIGPALWILAGLGLYVRHPVANFFVWFIFVGMIIGEPTHMLWFPMMQEGRYDYFPGMWTSLFPMIPAIYGVCMIIADERRRRAGDVSHAN